MRRTGVPHDVAFTNVGLFYSVKSAPLVPDLMLILDVRPEDVADIEDKRCYFVWDHDKVPDLVIEIVSNQEGSDLDRG